MDVSELRDLSLQLINQFSTDGVELSVAETSDFRLTFLNHLNTAQNTFSKRDKIQASHSLTQNPITNLLGDTFDITQHLDEDINFEADSAKSYYFEVDKACAVYVEEETATDVWTTLATLTLTPTSFTEYRGLITASDTDNAVRLRFSGSYIYNIRRVALYGYTFASASDVPQFKPWNVYALPADYLELKQIDYNGDSLYRNNLADYYIQKKNLYIKYDVVGSFDVFYYKRPTILTADGNEPEIEKSNHQYLSYYPAGQWLIGVGQQQNGSILLNQFQSFLNDVDVNNDETNSGIINVSGW